MSVLGKALFDLHLKVSSIDRKTTTDTLFQRIVEPRKTLILISFPDKVSILELMNNDKQRDYKSLKEKMDLRFRQVHVRHVH